MAKYRKWVGGGLGWALGGPIGALLGFVFGSIFDEMSGYGKQIDENGNQTQSGDFSVSLLILSAAVMKADGKVLKSELNYVKNYLTKYFGDEKAQSYLLMLRGFLQQDIAVIDICHQVDANMAYSGRLQLLHYLFGIAASDSHGVTEIELKLLASIAENIGITAADYISIRAMFVNKQYANNSAAVSKSDYQILGITGSATNDEVKSAYRKMALKYHPDRVLNLGEDVQKAAKEKFQKVQQAYENIKKSRGL